MNLTPQGKIIETKTIKNIIKVILLIFLFEYVFFPTPLIAESIMDGLENKKITKIRKNILESGEFENNFPLNKDLEVRSVGYHTMTAYNSEVAQCDSSPCITANGFNVCAHGVEDTVAANFLRFGTRVKIPELFGERIFIVRDRMNKRYTSRVDIWMLDKGDAIEFGRRVAKIEIMK